jgi:Ca2+-binding EF-hand superfamily protein
MAKRERQSKTTVNPVESTTGFYKELNRVKKTHPD